MGGAGFDGCSCVAASLLVVSVCEPQHRHIDPLRAGACWGALALTPTYGLCVHDVESIEPEGSSYKGLAMGGAGFDGRPRVSASLLGALALAPSYRATGLKALPTKSVR
jgi:hypothetical protein